MKSVSISIVLLFLFPYLVQGKGVELGINFHGFSYHPDRVDSEGNEFEEFNPGIGLNLLFYQKERNQFYFEGGVFRNSNGNAAGYLSLDYRIRLVRQFSAGVALTILNSSAVREGKWAIAPLPIISYRYHSVSVQLLYAPRYKDWNRNSVFASYITWYFWP